MTSDIAVDFSALNMLLLCTILLVFQQAKTSKLRTSK